MRLNQLLTEKPRPRRMGLVLAAALMCAAPLALAQGMLIKGAAAAPGETLFYSHAVLDKARLTSAFGMRKHPTTGEKKMHSGVDLAAPTGTPVYAPTDGSVTFSGTRAGYGNFVELALNDGTRLRFAQLDTTEVNKGELVKGGDMIGRVGTTGRSTGPHLHFETVRNGDYFDPQAEEGLVLADDLTILAASGAKAPLPPAPPEAPEAVPASPADLAPLPAAAPAPPIPPAAGGPPPSPASDRPDRCKGLDGWFKNTPAPAAWTNRQEAARAANQAAGVMLSPDWTPEALAYPLIAYPAEAAKAGDGAACDVLFDLDTEGFPKNAVARCSDPAFEATSAKLTHAQFKPVLDASGRPVEVKGVHYPMQFCIE